MRFINYSGLIRMDRSNIIWTLNRYRLGTERLPLTNKKATSNFRPTWLNFPH